MLVFLLSDFALYALNPIKAATTPEAAITYTLAISVIKLAALSNQSTEASKIIYG